MSSSFMYGIDISKVRYWLQTHSHSDHFDAGHLITRISEYATINPPQLNLYASRNCIEHMSIYLSIQETGATLLDKEWQHRLNIDVQEIKHADNFKAGIYEITAFESLHDTNDSSLLYAVRDKHSSIFYGTDTVELSEKVWECFKDRHMKFDVVILGHTAGILSNLLER